MAQDHYYIYATLEYKRHFIFAGCYDNHPWYLVTNFTGHLDLAGFYFSKCPANFATRYQVQAHIFIL
jgi:hypothetical protein